MKILSAEQMHQWDEFTIQHEPVSSLDLMERAAQKCTDWLVKKFGSDKSVKIFCGKGNNGGDGLAIARQLAENNIIADVYILEFGNIGTDDFQANLSRLHSYPVNIHFVQEKGFLPSLQKDDIVIDALLGSGIRRPLEGLYSETVQYINDVHATVVAIDLPTGLFADKSSLGNIIIKAAYTLTFQSLKLSFVFPENEQYTGIIKVLEIGLHKDFIPAGHSIFHLADKKIIRQLYKPRKNFSHKGTYGHALIVAGERGKMGAAVLCTKACLRSGAGLVSAAIPGDQFSILQIAAPEALVLAHNDLSPDSFAKYATVGIGPGIGTAKEAVQLLRVILSNFDKPVVADADALNILSADNALLNDLPPGSILTPHPKEFERLFGTSQNHYERIQTARYYAQKLFVYIILKGHYSMLACPDGEVYFNNTGNAGMATGGTGDVLTGIVTGLVAQGYSPKDACILGMHLHGLSGDIAAARISKEALIAEDVIDYLGKSFLKI